MIRNIIGDGVRALVAIVLALLAALATLGVLAAMACVTPVMAQEPAAAEPYASVSVEKLADGTGHGTAAQTFVNSANGFSPGDESADDGVVASGDTVTYLLRLRFTAAGRRDVRVAWDLPERLSAQDIGCYAGRVVTATADGGSACLYHVPAGAVESLERVVTLTAGDTAGVAVGGVRPSVTFSRPGGRVYTVRAEALTIVSAPRADLVVDNGGLGDEGDKAERVSAWADSGRVSGWFDLRIRHLTYPGHTTTHGASGAGEWNATVDVSAFPASTAWTVGGEPVEASGGRLRIEHAQGEKRLEWSIPAIDPTIRGMDEGGVISLDIHVAPDEGSFQAQGGTALANNGDGGQPGDGMARDASTRDARTGAIAGYPYANNDHSRAIIERPASWQSEGDHIFGRYHPLAPAIPSGATRFDREGREFAASGATRAIDEHGVARDTQVLHRLMLWPGNMPDCGRDCDVRLAYQWDAAQERYDGDLRVLLDGRPLDSRLWRVEWSADAMADASGGDGVWHTGTPGVTARAIRLRLRDDIGYGVASDGGTLEMRFVSRAVADPSRGNVRVEGETRMRMAGRLTTKPLASSYWVVAAGDPEATLTADARASSSDGLAADPLDLRPSDVVTYTIEPHIANIADSSTTLDATVTAGLPEGLSAVENLTPQWTMRRDGRTLTFTLAGHAPTYDADGAASLPVIRWSATVSNLAQGTLASACGMRALAAGTVAISNTATTQVAVTQADMHAARVTALNERVEAGDALRWRFDIVDRGIAREGTVTTVLRLPSNQDSAMTGAGNTGLDGTWEEYTLGSSAFHGRLALAEPVELDGENTSEGTVATYATDERYSDDPDDYQWRAWDTLSPTERARVTAIRIVSPFTRTSTRMACAQGEITLSADGNQTDDRYHLWIGRSRFSAGATVATMPWPARILVSDASIAGRLWWDENGDGRIGAAESGIASVSVGLWRTDEQGAAVGTALATTRTAADGSYRFDRLRHGDYLVRVTRDGEHGVPRQRDDYYGRTHTVRNTATWNARVGTRATDSSDRIALDVGETLADVNFGYDAPDPKITVDKTQTRLECPDDTAKACTVAWDVVVDNAGDLTIDAEGMLTDRTSGDVTALAATAGTLAHTPDSEVTFASVHSGGTFAYAIDVQGRLWSWGRNDYGQLGLGDTTDRHVPTRVPTDRTFTAVETATNGMLALDSQGHLWAAGQNQRNVLGDTGSAANYAWNDKTGFSTLHAVMPERTWASISVSSELTLAIDPQGRLWSWGVLSDGLGVGRPATSSLASAWVEPTRLDLEQTFSVVQAGTGAAFAIDTQGHLWSWGDNCRFSSQGSCLALGDGTTGGRTSPAKVMTNRTWRDVVTSGNLTNCTVLALDASGKLWVWGRNASQRTQWTLGIDAQSEATPTALMPTRTWTSIAGGIVKAAIDTQGHVWMWGPNTSGVFGDGTATASVTPRLVRDDHTHIAMANGAATFALDADGRIRSTGSGKRGALGLGPSVATVAVPTLIDMREAGDLSDGTAVPVTPVSVSRTGDLVERSYRIPAAIAPGARVVFHFSGTVMRSDQRRPIVNQAWFDSPNTPYAGVPHARAAGVGKPAAPDAARLHTATHDIVGNATCRSGGDYASAELEHSFAAGNEDSCDQVGAMIPADSDAPVLGSIGGLAWLDGNANGLRDAGERLIDGSVTVALWSVDDSGGETKIDETVTDENGRYVFDRLAMGAYRIWFALGDARHGFTLPGQGNGVNDSDASDRAIDYGSAGVLTLSSVAPSHGHVDAGVVVTSPTIGLLPFAGGHAAAVPLLFLALIGGLAVVGARRTPTTIIGKDTIMTRTSTIASLAAAAAIALLAVAGVAPGALAADSAVNLSVKESIAISSADSLDGHRLTAANLAEYIAAQTDGSVLTGVDMSTNGKLMQAIASALDQIDTDAAKDGVQKPSYDAKNPMKWVSTNLRENASPQWSGQLRELAGLLARDATVSSSATINATVNDVTATFSGLTPGVYLILDSTAAGTPASLPMIVSTKAGGKSFATMALGVAQIKLSSVAPPVKAIVESDGGASKTVDATHAAIGESITYRITQQVPNWTGYDGYRLHVVDTLGEGLTYGELIGIEVNGKALQSEQFTETVSERTVTWTMGGAGDDILATEALRTLFAPGVNIRIDYRASINTQGVIAGAGNPNTVRLDHTADQRNKGVMRQVPGNTVTAYTGSFSLNKIDGQGAAIDAALGARFHIYKVEGGLRSGDALRFSNTGTGTYTLADNQQGAGLVGDIPAGKAVLNGMDGEYEIVEVSTPQGYLSVFKPTFRVSVATDAKGTTLSMTKQDGDGLASIDTVNARQVNIVNLTSMTQLPMTGSTMRTIMSVVAVSLIAGGGALALRASRRIGGR
ncbi:SdrD B-like domain-containing protein [Bifidobacterium eulemuris]|uniref:Isopeptide-forming domain-containing fimbrial protein n=1 Tax=Bifidobacterium eulemuris TaxID=1765219 RepID=A0A261G3K6_9BIFI|nr:SdrD B-like domain-containing protein [Bifidobacterium eulemuris]OZG66004.1 RCC1 repeat-containing protein [Bifidobacterium eulemuris]QOL32059.1 isopeptide-forming domain-containing fimbrial protein [Bifidobacterium eulemuris]